MLTVGQQFEGLKIKDTLAESSLTATYLAERPNKEKVVLKIFKDETFIRENEISYLRRPREAISQGIISNQAYLSFYKKVATAELPQIGKRAFLVRGYVAGKNMAQWRNSLASLSEATNIFRKICQGLNHLHRAELIHGGLCPQNIIIGDGTLKITDFGTGTNYLTAVLRKEGIRPEIRSFLPPWFDNRQKFNHPATDIYALGAILYFMQSGTAPEGIPEDAIPPVRKAMTGVYKDVGDFMQGLEQLIEEGGQIIELEGQIEENQRKKEAKKGYKNKDGSKSPERVPEIDIQGDGLEPEPSGLSYRLEKTLKKKKERFSLTLNNLAEDGRSLTVNLSVASGAEWIRVKPRQITLTPGQQPFWITLGTVKASETMQGKIVLEIPLDDIGGLLTREINVSATFKRPYVFPMLKWAAVIPFLILMFFFFSDIKRYGTNYLTQAVDFWNQLRADKYDDKILSPLKNEIDETLQPEKEDISGPQAPAEEDTTKPLLPLKEDIAAVPSQLEEGIDEPVQQLDDNITEQLDRIEIDLLDRGEYVAAKKKLVNLQAFQPDNARISNLLMKLSERLVIKAGLIIYPGRVAQPGEAVTIASGSGFKLQVISDDIGYLYIFQLDSHDNLYQLFPNNGAMERQNPLEPDTAYQIPKGEDDWFVLDQRIGDETIFLVASRWPARDIEEIFRYLSRTTVESEKIEHHHNLLDRLTARRLANADGVAGCFYEEISFWHDK